VPAVGLAVEVVAALAALVIEEETGS